jgi:hypothetical protein
MYSSLHRFESAPSLTAISSHLSHAAVVMRSNRYNKYSLNAHTIWYTLSSVSEISVGLALP